MDGRDHRLEMSARGHFRYDAAEAGVFLDAGSDRVGQQLMSGNDPDTGFVT